MPVSSPSYFPPSRANGTVVGITAGVNTTGAQSFLAGNQAGESSTSSGLIIIGYDSGNGGIVNAPNTIILGVNSGQSIIQSDTKGYSAEDAGIIIGYNSLNNTASVNGSVVIGSNNFKQLTPATSAEDYQGIQNSVVLGSGMMNGSNALTNANAQIASSVIIGYGFNPDNTYWAGVEGCILIGSEICNSNYSNQFNGAVVIGNNACASGVPNACVIIGQNAVANCVNGASAAYLIAIGSSSAPNITTGGGGIYIGANAGYGFDNTHSWIVIGAPLSGTYAGSASISVLENPQADGGANVSLGGLVNISNLTIAGTRNTVCLQNGTVGSTNPVGGGYFYVSAGALHWVGSNGTDTQIAPA